MCVRHHKKGRKKIGKVRGWKYNLLEVSSRNPSPSLSHRVLRGTLLHFFHPATPRLSGNIFSDSSLFCSIASSFLGEA